jgi:hypothetical protein
VFRQFISWFIDMMLWQSTVRRLNERGVGLLVKTAGQPRRAEGLVAGKEIYSMWAHASETILIRAARCPMVLLDFNFQRPAWWSQIISSQSSGVTETEKLHGFPAEEAIPLARDLLLEAWSAARSMSPVSSLLFGMAPEVTRLITRLSAADVDRLVMREVQELRLRWENRPMFWAGLFRSATQPDDQLLANTHLHCLQLLGGELTFARGNPRPLTQVEKGPLREPTAQEVLRRSAHRASSV